MRRVYLFLTFFLVLSGYLSIHPTQIFAAACGAGSGGGGPCNLYGQVFVDNPPTGTVPGPEDTLLSLPAGSVTLSGQANGSSGTNASGYYYFYNELSGTYTVKLKLPAIYAGYTVKGFIPAFGIPGTNPATVTMAPLSAGNPPGSAPIDNLLLNFALIPPVGPLPTDTPTPPVSGACVLPQTQVEGFFSADRNFIINGKNDGTDLKLHVGGSVTVNAGRLGGGFILGRNPGGAKNLLDPAFTITVRPDMILNTPDLLKQHYYLYKELAP